MSDDKAALVDGERQLGRYTVVLLLQSGSGHWSPSVMQLDATVTNYRLMLRPFKRKYEPASLPSHYIRHIEMAKKSRYHCVAMKVITNHVLYVMLSTGKLEDLFDDLSAMKQRPPKFAFDDKVARADIERLITFFGQQPQPDVT